MVVSRDFCAYLCQFRALTLLWIAWVVVGCGVAITPAAGSDGAAPEAGTGCPSVDAINRGSVLGAACAPEGAYCTDESCDACTSDCAAVSCTHGTWRTTVNTALCVTDSGVTAEDVGADDASACATLNATGLDTSCTGDADCIAVSVGCYCPSGGYCFCAADTINARERDAYDARYQAALTAIGDASRPGCSCPFFGRPSCVSGRCVLCGGAAAAHPGCPDAG